MRVSVAEARNTLPKLLYEAEENEIIVTRRGKPTAVIIPFKEYQTLKRLKAYMGMIRLSTKLKVIGLTATELYEASRQELEERP